MAARQRPFYPASLLITMTTLEDKSLWQNNEGDDDIEQEIRRLSPEEINNRTRLLENDIKVKRPEPAGVSCRSPKQALFAGHEVRGCTSSARTSGNEREDQGQQRENQDEQATTIPRWKRCRGKDKSTAAVLLYL